MGSASLEHSHTGDLPDENLVLRVKGHCKVNAQDLAVGMNKHGKLSLAPHESGHLEYLQPNRDGMLVTSLY